MTLHKGSLSLDPPRSNGFLDTATRPEVPEALRVFLLRHSKRQVEHKQLLPSTCKSSLIPGPQRPLIVCHISIAIFVRTMVSCAAQILHRTERSHAQHWRWLQSFYITTKGGRISITKSQAALLLLCRSQIRHARKLVKMLWPRSICTDMERSFCYAFCLLT